MIKSFWEWWNKDSQRIMELRIKDFKWIKHLATKFNLDYSSSGVFVKSYEELLNVLKECRNHVTVWFGVNPRKQAINEKGWKVFGGKDVNVESISFIMIDIDRKDKDGVADDEYLKKLKEVLLTDVLKDFEKNGLNDYALIFSGNGFQIILRLDEDIVMPKQEFDKENKIYLPNEQLQKYKRLVKEVFGKRMIKKYSKVLKKVGADIDMSSFNIGRVAALPGSFNFKYGHKKERRLIKIGVGKNEGLSDSLINELENLCMPVFNKNRINKKLSAEFKYSNVTIVNSILAQFIIKGKLKNNTGINNSLIFQFKCLCKDNNIDLNCKEVLHIKMIFEKTLKRVLAWNLPSMQSHFNPNVVNNYCVRNNLPLLYEALPDKVIKRSFLDHIFTWKNFALYPLDDVLMLDGVDILESIYLMRKELDKESDIRIIVKQIYAYTHGLIKKFDVDDVQYAFENYFPNYLIK